MCRKHTVVFLDDKHVYTCICHVHTYICRQTYLLMWVGQCLSLKEILETVLIAGLKYLKLWPHKTIYCFVWELKNQWWSMLWFYNYSMLRAPLRWLNLFNVTQQMLALVLRLRSFSLHPKTWLAWSQIELAPENLFLNWKNWEDRSAPSFPRPHPCIQRKWFSVRKSEERPL